MIQSLYFDYKENPILKIKFSQEDTIANVYMLLKYHKGNRANEHTINNFKKPFLNVSLFGDRKFNCNKLIANSNRNKIVDIETIQCYNFSANWHQFFCFSFAICNYHLHSTHYFFTLITHLAHHNVTNDKSPLVRITRQNQTNTNFPENHQPIGLC